MGGMPSQYGVRTLLLIAVILPLPCSQQLDALILSLLIPQIPLRMTTYVISTKCFHHDFNNLIIVWLRDHRYHSDHSFYLRYITSHHLSLFTSISYRLSLSLSLSPYFSPAFFLSHSLFPSVSIFHLLSVSLSADISPSYLFPSPSDRANIWGDTSSRAEGLMARYPLLFSYCRCTLWVCRLDGVDSDFWLASKRMVKEERDIHSSSRADWQAENSECMWNMGRRLKWKRRSTYDHIHLLAHLPMSLVLANRSSHLIYLSIYLVD